MRFTLRDNAADSLRRSVSYFSEGTQSGVKAAIKELISALELYVKVQLTKLDADPSNPVLVFDKFTAQVHRPSGKYELRPVGVATIKLSQAFERLAWLGQPIADADRTQLSQLKKIRNSIEHFAVDENTTQVRDLYATAIGFAIRYLHVYVGENFLDIVDDEAWHRALQLEPRLRSAAERSASEIYDDLTAAADRAFGTSVCQRCGADMIVDLPGNWSAHRCVVCGFKHVVESCYRCGRVVFWDLLREAEGGRMLCDECSEQD